MPAGHLDAMQRRLVQAEFKQRLKRLDGSPECFCEALEKEWKNRLVVQDVERLWEDMGDGVRMPRARIDRFQEVFAMIKAAS